ncbi:MAG: Uma2 family endonuclease [Leptolyngbya sp. SIO4C1]|nr:Uma2 family endonuclease [Leptolyngbya sp. SIO4C1]
MTLALVSPATLQTWQPATWADYIALRDSADQRIKLAFNQGWLWVDMGKEGINHASFCDLFTMLFAFWALQFPDEQLSSFGRCLIEKPETQACAPDLVLYKGDGFPRWQKGMPRRIDLRQHRVPDLVGEISDTTLANDLDEQKRLYASLGIPEYWVVDVKGLRVFAFRLNKKGDYEACERSDVLLGLPISLLEETLEQLAEQPNTVAAAWFAQQIRDVRVKNRSGTTFQNSTNRG